MNRIRIEFLKDGKAIKAFDRSVHEKSEAAQLAEEIAKDSGIPHDAKKISFERKFKAKLTLPSGKTELIESKALDEAEAQAIAAKWAALTKIEFTAVKIAFLEA